MLQEEKEEAGLVAAATGGALGIACLHQHKSPLFHLEGMFEGLFKAGDSVGTIFCVSEMLDLLDDSCYQLVVEERERT